MSAKIQVLQNTDATEDIYPVTVTKAIYDESNKTLQSLLDEKQPILTAGDNITIENNVISATGSSSAVTGVKGDAEETYRDGNVNITAENLGLATVATSGKYTDLSDTPTLATVATSGSYNDLGDTPTIPTVPTNISSFTNDSGYITSSGSAHPIFENGTWYIVGDDAYIGDHNQGGAFCVKGANASPKIMLYNSDDSYNSTVLTTANLSFDSSTGTLNITT